MMNKQEIIQAIQNEGFIMKDGNVYVWKREMKNRARGCSGCILEDRPDCLYICNACLDLDEIMPRKDYEAGGGRFEEGDKEAYKKALSIINQKIKSCK